MANGAVEHPFRSPLSTVRLHENGRFSQQSSAVECPLTDLPDGDSFQWRGNGQRQGRRLPALEHHRAEAQQQILNTAQMPFVFKHVAVMPDCHYGKGATVGTVLPTEGAVIPAAVGVDIGCGMIAVRTPLTRADIPRRGRPRRHRTAHPDERRQEQHEAHRDGRRRGSTCSRSSRPRHARHAGPIRQELAAGARNARRRQSLHRAGRGRRRRRLGDAAFRLARRRQQDWQPLHQGRAGARARRWASPARSRPRVSAGGPPGVCRLHPRPELGAAVRAAQSQRDDGPRADGGERRGVRRGRHQADARAAAHQLPSQLHAGGTAFRPAASG